MKETVKTTRAGKAGSIRWTCGDLSACFSFLHAELRVHQTPGFPCALQGEHYTQNSGASDREHADACARGRLEPSRQPTIGMQQAMQFVPAGEE